jgi:hypothetical protein
MAWEASHFLTIQKYIILDKLGDLRQGDTNVHPKLTSDSEHLVQLQNH